MSKYLKTLPLVLAACFASMPGYADLLVRGRFQKELSGEPAPAPPAHMQNSEESWGSPLKPDGNPVKNSGKGSGSNSGNDGSNGASEWGGPNRKKSDGGAAKNSESDGSNGASEWGGPSRKKSDGSAAKNSESDGSNGASEWGGPNRKKSDGNTAKNSGQGSGSNSGDDGANGETAWGGHGSQYNKDFPPLTATDEKMMPDPNPPGMPSMPSKCAENSDCKPCYAEANAALNKQRMNLEKVRAIYDYTHRFTSEGLDFMNGAAAAGGGIAQMGAAAETKKVNGALDEFDATVRSKNKELLGELQKGLQKMAVCEADYFDNDDWYMRYGEVYFQFMQARYSN